MCAFDVLVFVLELLASALCGAIRRSTPCFPRTPTLYECTSYSPLQSVFGICSYLRSAYAPNKCPAPATMSHQAPARCGAAVRSRALLTACTVNGKFELPVPVVNGPTKETTGTEVDAQDAPSDAAVNFGFGRSFGRDNGCGLWVRVL